MKTAFLLTAVQNGAKRIAMGFVLLVAATFLHQDATAVPIDLGAASSFAVLADSGISFYGVNTITGDIGTFPTTTIDGTGTYSFTGAPWVNHAGDSFTQSAKTALDNAYNVALIQPSSTVATELGAGGAGNIMPPGVYGSAAGTFQITGILRLDAGGNPNAVFIFKMGTTLTTAVDSQVELINGAQANNVFWQVGSSATLGTSSDFVGNILASESITLNDGARVYGRVLAKNAHVTLNGNTITNDFTASAGVPDTGSTLLLLGSGLTTLLAFRRRFFSPA